MSDGNPGTERSNSAQTELRQAFIGWQCRLRQLSIRRHGGRPTSGMRPMLSVGPDDLRPVTVVINKADPEETVVQFQYIAKRTHDPRERYEAALKYLAGAYYQTPRSFHDCLAAVFGPDEEFPSKLIQYPDCALLFEQYGQRYRIPCRARLLDKDTPLYLATFWHNALFNPSLPGTVQIVAFSPDWVRAEADPSSI